jgi:hypothetical protein
VLWASKAGLKGYVSSWPEGDLRVYQYDVGLRKWSGLSL